MSSIPNEIPEGVFTLSPGLLDVVRRYWIIILAFFAAGVFWGFAQKEFSTEYHARAIIYIGHVIEKDRSLYTVEPNNALASKLREDLLKTRARNVRTTHLVNDEDKKITVTAVAVLPDAEEAKKEFDAVIDSHLERLRKMEKETGRTFTAKTMRGTPPSGDVFCTAGCRTTFSLLYAVTAALTALIGCMLFDGLKGRKSGKGS